MLRLPIHAWFGVGCASVLLAMAVAVLSILRHVILFALSSDVVEHGAMLAISVLLVAHLVHVRSSVLRVLLAVGVRITVWIAALRPLGLMYLLRGLALLSRHRRVGRVVAAILRFLLTISGLRPTSGILALRVLSSRSKSTA